MNQSLCANTSILIIKMAMLRPDNLVSKFPKGFLIKPLIINTNPVNSSDKATVDANIGDRPKYSINP